MSGKCFVFAGLAMRALPDGALFIPGASTLVVADMHLEKGSAFASHGAFLPPYDSGETLRRLARRIEALRPARVVCLGDSFHDGAGPERLASGDRTQLRRLTGEREWIWIAGNHDPAATAFFGGRISRELGIGPHVFRHEARIDAAAGEISGHFHPKASVTVHGRRVSARCFVVDSRRLILPSFGAYTGGLDVFDPALRNRVEPVFQVHLIGRDRVHSVSSTVLDRTRPGGGDHTFR